MERELKGKGSLRLGGRLTGSWTLRRSTGPGLCWQLAVGSGQNRASAKRPLLQADFPANAWQKWPTELTELNGAQGSWTDVVSSAGQGHSLLPLLPPRSTKQLQPHQFHRFQCAVFLTECTNTSGPSLVSRTDNAGWWEVWIPF